jgi:hypothetical protein
MYEVMSNTNVQIGFKEIISRLFESISNNANCSLHFLGFIFGIIFESIKKISCFLFSVFAQILCLLFSVLAGVLGFVVVAFIPILIIVAVSALFTSCGSKDNKYSYNKYAYQSSSSVPGSYSQNKNSSYNSNSPYKEKSHYKSHQSTTPIKYATTSGTASGSVGNVFGRTDDKVSISDSSYNSNSPYKEDSRYKSHQSTTPTKYATTSGTASGSVAKDFSQTDDKVSVSNSSYSPNSPYKEDSRYKSHQSTTPIKYATTSGTASGSVAKDFSQTDDKVLIGPSYLASNNLAHPGTDRRLDLKNKNLAGPTGPIGPKGAVGPMGLQGLPGQDGTLPIWELCFSLAGVLILLYFSKLTIDAYWKKWLIKTGKTTWIQFDKE